MRLYTLEQAAKLVDPDMTEKVFANHVREAERRYGDIFRDKSHRTHRMSLRQIELLVRLTWPNAAIDETLEIPTRTGTAIRRQSEALTKARAIGRRETPLAEGPGGASKPSAQPVMGQPAHIGKSGPRTRAGSRRGETARQIAELDAKIMAETSGNVTPFPRGRRHSD
ncbi:MAG: hypothetical protein VYB54_15730 [Pseudomonadota bacterium]|nr:hypothetical protein [Pseudomonadota bacterium]